MFALDRAEAHGGSVLGAEQLLIDQMREARERLHLSQEEAAQLIGVRFSTLNRWENGRSQPGLRSRTLVQGWLRGAAAAAQPSMARGHPGLPADSAGFIGRVSELAELAGLWPRCRMLTLTGTGGIGKTRLATELLRRSEETLLGVVQLDAVGDPALVIPEIGAGLRIRARPGVPESDAIIEAMRESAGVLFLDTCERVTTSLRGLLRELLETAPKLQVLATSRIPVDVPGEQVWRVPGLGLPATPGSAAVAVLGDARPADEPASGDAVSFFVTRARERTASFAPDQAMLRDVAQICERLDGIPLALGLAAAWMESAVPADLLQRWGEREELLVNATAEPARHRTMLAAIEWSADLLAPADRELVASLSAFSGPFTASDVQAVAAGLTGTQLMLALRRLTAASWLEFSPGPPGRYRLLEPLRDWASRELEVSEQAEAARRRHAEHFRDLCVQAESERFRIDPDDWPRRLELLYGNLQAALDWCIRRDAETGAQIAVSLLGWWRLSGRLALGRHWLKALSRAGISDLARARAQCSTALLAMDAGDYDDVEHLARIAMTVLEDHSDARWTGRALTALSSAAKYKGKMAEARGLLERARKLQQKNGDQRELAATLNNLGSLAADEKDLPQAERYYQLSLKAKQGRDDDRSVALTMANLADIATQDGRFGEARATLDEAMTIVERLDDNFLRAFLRINLGENLLRGGDSAGALTPFREALAFAASAGAGRFRLLATCGLGQALCATGDKTEGIRLLRECRRAARQMGDEIAARQAEQALRPVPDPRQQHSRSGLLTDRENQVMEQVSSGLSNREIASTLRISGPTVQRHLANVFQKLEVKNRTAAVRAWTELRESPLAAPRRPGRQPRHRKTVTGQPQFGSGGCERA